MPDSDQPPAADRATYRSGFMFGTLTFVAVAGLGVASTILTARVYGVRIVGQYALVWAPVAALWVLSTVKEQQALIRELTSLAPRDPRVTQLFAAVFTFSLLFTVAVSLLAALACWLVFRGPLHAPALLLPALVNIAGYALLMNAGWNLDSILSSFMAGRQIFWVRLHEVLGFIAIAVAVGLLWRSVWGLVIAIVGTSLSTLVHRALVARRFVRMRLSLAEYREGLRFLPGLLRFGLKATPGAIAQGISQQGGVWALGTVAPVGVVGAYSRAQMVPQRLQQATNRITEVLYPTLVGRHASGDGEGFDRALVDSIRYEVIGMLGIAAALGGCARGVLEIFGPGFGRATTALALLAAFPALASIAMTQTQALWAADRPGRTSLIALARLAVTLALLIVLTPSLGIAGPAVALLAGYLLVIALSGLALRGFMSQPLRAIWPSRQRWALLASYGAGFVVAHALQKTDRSVALVPFELLAGLLAYSFVFLICGGVNDRDRVRLAEGRSWLRARRTRASATPAEAASCAE
jgi:O-antigen/teichoic acid export membrane protein